MVKPNEITHEHLEKRREALKPVKNLRRTNHRCCANCKHLKSVAGVYSYSIAEPYCERTGGDHDMSEMAYLVCDRHAWA